MYKELQGSSEHDPLAQALAQEDAQDNKRALRAFLKGQITKDELRRQLSNEAGTYIATHMCLNEQHNLKCEQEDESDVEPGMSEDSDSVEVSQSNQPSVKELLARIRAKNGK